jgi:hypothetical protein
LITSSYKLINLKIKPGYLQKEENKPWEIHLDLKKVVAGTLYIALGKQFGLLYLQDVFPLI